MVFGAVVEGSSGSTVIAHTSGKIVYVLLSISITGIGFWLEQLIYCYRILEIQAYAEPQQKINSRRSLSNVSNGIYAKSLGRYFTYFQHSFSLALFVTQNHRKDESAIR